MSPSNAAGAYGSSVACYVGREWTGGAGGAGSDFSDAANWSGGTAPNQNEAAVFG